MATSKIKSNESKTGKPQKTAIASKTVKVKRAKILSQVPTEDEIREKAQEIYNSRLTHGEPGTAEGDWINAERLLKA